MTDGIVGLIVGAFAMVLIELVFHVQGRAKCEAPLPRTEQCVLQWVPEKGVQHGAK